MARQPIQVHTYLYRERNGEYEYAIFQRSDMPVCWQGVIGGLEDGEDLETGARRELFEEAGVTDKCPLYRLESISYMPVDAFKATNYSEIWGEKVVVVPVYYFAMPYDKEIILSDEHLDMKWLPFKEARELVYFYPQKTVLYELNERLLRGILVDC